MEVECKRKDGSWHPCQISLSEDNAAIIVTYENCGEEEEEEQDSIESKAEGLARLRFRSAILQGGECSRVKEGQSVLALHDSSSSNLFFDAIVEKINKVRHSDRLACRCTFSLKWLPIHLKDQKVIVPSTCIMQLSDKNIEAHPVFEAFIKSINSSAEMEIPAFASPLSEDFFGVNLDGLVERQVQEIITAQGDCSEDVMVGFKKAKQKGVKTKKLPESNSGRRVTRSKSKQETEIPLEEAIEKGGSGSSVSPKESTEKGGIRSFLSPLAAGTNNGRRVTRITSKQETETPLKGAIEKSGSGSSISREESPEQVGIRSFLSPLAARAALASLMSTLPVTEPSKQPGKLCLSPKMSKIEISSSPLFSPLAAHACLASFASDHPTSGLPKQVKKPLLTPDQSDYNSRPGRRQNVNSDSEKVNFVIPQRVTRATKREDVDLIPNIEGLQKIRKTEKGKREQQNDSFSSDVEDVVTPAKTENKKRIGISPSASAATSASIATTTITESEGETCQDAESQTVAKKRKIVSRTPPTRFSPRLAQLSK